MGRETGIQWCDHTWSPWRGCAKVSPGCANCYAERLSHRNPAVLGEWGPTGKRAVNQSPETPLRWDRAAEKAGKRRRVFPSLCDPFEGREDLRVPLADFWHLIWRTPSLDWLVLTKRPENAKRFLDRWADLSGEAFEPKLVRGPEATRKAHPSGRGQIWADMMEAMGEPPPGCAYPPFDWMEGPICWPNFPYNLWLGVSVEDQRRADERVPALLGIPASVRWLSVEPLLGPVDCGAYLGRKDGAGACPTFRASASDPRYCKCGRGSVYHRDPLFDRNGIDWVIVGGESGPDARPCDIAWIRSIVHQCRAAGVPCFVKQLGSVSIGGGEIRGMRHRKGGDPIEWPKDLRVREMPTHTRNMGAET